MSMDSYARMATLRNVSFPQLKDDSQCPLFIKSIDQVLTMASQHGAVLFPNLIEHTRTVQIFSDYGGTHKGAEYRTYSFLLSSYDSLYYYYQNLETMRRKHNIWKPLKEISFKDLNHAGLSSALEDYLALSNNMVVGLLVTVIIDKSVKSVTGPNTDQNLAYITKILKENGLGSWKPKVAEKVVFTVHLISYLLSFLSKSDQNVFWMTDNDEISANEEKHKALASLWQRIIPLYSDNRYAFVGYANPFKDRDFHTMDLLSLPDLAAGAVEHYYSRRKKLDDLTVSDGANKILLWLSVQGVGLKKLCIHLDSKDDQLVGSLVAIRPKSVEFLSKVQTVVI